jgi:hypothetical protein
MVSSFVVPILLLSRESKLGLCTIVDKPVMHRSCTAATPTIAFLPQGNTQDRYSKLLALVFQSV